VPDLAPGEDSIIGDRRIQELVARNLEMSARRLAPELSSGPKRADGPPEVRRSPDVIARLLGERGFWSLTPAAQLELFEVEDLVGRLEVVPTARGAAGMREALVFSALASLWADGPRDSPEVITSVRALAEQAALSWSGQASTGILEALEVLRLTGYRFVVQSRRAGHERTFTLLSELETEWTGAPTSPRRRVRVVLDEVVAAWLADKRNIRPIDVGVLRALGPQRELARRLFLLLEVHGAGEVDGGREVLNRLVDERLAGTLGTRTVMKKLVPALRRAGEAIESAAPRYESVRVISRERRLIVPGEARYLIRAERRRLARALQQKPEKP
jgi:hypothetical protein